jgi:hypothetical protein
LSPKTKKHEVEVEEEEEKEGFSDVIKQISPNFTMTDYIKRFFYQIIGIYFPPVVLILYFLLFWKEQPHLFSLTLNISSSSASHIVSPEENLKSLLSFIDSHNQILQLLLFVIGVAALGEAINSITSKIAKISPIKTTYLRERYFVIKGKKIPLIDRIPLINKIPFGRSIFRWDLPRIADWPIWLNITRFPVNFAHFDRYYVSVLEQDKRTLAGKIGWLSFYRNMTAVFIIISVLQIYLIYHFSIVHQKLLYDNYLYEYYVLAITLVSIVLFYLGHHAQVNAHRTTLWDAYRRNELRKNLEIRYGELSLALGIRDKYKKRTIEYMVDRWFLGVEHSMQSLSSFVLTIVREVYKAAKKDQIENNNNNISVNEFVTCFLREAKEPVKWYIKPVGHRDHLPSLKLNEIEPELRQLLMESYKEWNVGGYTQVLSYALRALKIFHLSLTQRAWQTMSGQYTLENSLRTDAAYKEVEAKVIEWGWTYNKIQPQKETTSQDKSGKKADSANNTSLSDHFDKKQDFDEAANIISSSADAHRLNFDKIMDMLKQLRKMRTEYRKRADYIHDVEKIDVTLDELVTDDNKKQKIIKVDIDGKISTVSIDNNNAFTLVDDGKKLEVDFDGIVSDVHIFDGKVLEIDLKNRLNTIYCLFGASEYDNAGEEAEKLLADIKIAQKLLSGKQKEQQKISQITKAPVGVS